MRFNLLLAAVALAAIPATVFAHAGHPTPADGMFAGALHVLGGADHALAALAVGFWGARTADGRNGLLLPTAFAFAVAFGFAVGALLRVGAPLEWGVAGSVVLLGAIVALDWRAHFGVALLTIAAFGLIHGHAHGVELRDGVMIAPFGLGLIAGTTALAALGWLAGRATTSPALGRVLGGAAAIAGLLIAAS